MFVSKKNGWHYFISWDNPQPADSRSMLAALGGLGRVTSLETKTTIVLSPRQGVTPQQVRNAIKKNLHRRKGNAFYVNLRSGKGFQIGAGTSRQWKKAP